MINRAVLILKFKQPALKWINESDPYNENPEITIEDVNKENTVYLISEEDSESPDTLNDWLELNYSNLFESELENWCMDEKLWPQERTFSIFQQWFSYDCHTIIVDTVEGPIVDEDDDIDDTYH
ncbi:MAG: hypothetical protein QM504_15185 [Pseudomonadota bacterium]